MENDSLKRTEKILGRIFILLGCVAVAGIVLLIRSSTGESKNTKNPVASREEQTVTDFDWEAGLSDSTYWLPTNCSLASVIPDITFSDTKGREHSISEWKGKPTIVVFWASWCEDCKEQMSSMQQFMEIAALKEEISFVFINKTDGEKETKENAERYFLSLNFEEECYFDLSLQAYNAIGVHNIPTTLFLDEEGRIASWSASQITETGVFEALLNNMIDGSSLATAGFVQTAMTDANGGIHNTYQAGQKVDAGSEVLSESQGLMLLYASEAGNKEMFDSALAYVKQYMWENGLASWSVERGQASKVNALIDDLRIYRGLKKAQELWGGYEEDILYCESTLLEFGIDKRKYVDFYDAGNKEYASRFTLCYTDLDAMEMLSLRNEEFLEAYAQAQEIVERGQISDEFPLYYSWYNYDKKRYEKDELNTAEAMVTLYHLAKQDKLKGNTVKWLKSRMNGEGIKARYTVDGDVVRGYEYDSTAVYAIVAMIADEIGDETLRGQALKKMEKMHIADTSLAYNGAYGMEDGSGITSFDQLMPMLAYIYMENQ